MAFKCLIRLNTTSVCLLERTCLGGLKKNTQIYTTSDLSLLRPGPDMQKVFKICLCLKLLSFSKHKSKTEFLLLRPQWMYFSKKKCLLLTEDPTTKLQHVNRHNLSYGRETPNYQNEFFTRNFIIRKFQSF